MKNIFLAVMIALIPFSTYAEIIDLVCTAPNGVSINYEVDTSHNVVLANGKPASNVLIDRGVINFVTFLNGDDELIHSINRSTGSMTVHALGKSMLPIYRCEKSTPKF